MGAGIGGLELGTILSETMGDQFDLTLIAQNDSFYFGFPKLDVMFGAGARFGKNCLSVKTGVSFRK